MRVLLFARARELAGVEAVEVALPPNATVADQGKTGQACQSVGSPSSTRANGPRLSGGHHVRSGSLSATTQRAKAATGQIERRA